MRQRVNQSKIFENTSRIYICSIRKKYLIHNEFKKPETVNLLLTEGSWDISAEKIKKSIVDYVKQMIKEDKSDEINLSYKPWSTIKAVDEDFL